MSTRIVLVDDHELVRDGISALLNTQPGLEVVGFAANGRDALRAVKNAAPDLVVMDVSMPEMNGIEATRQILHEQPEVKVLALSVHSDHNFVIEMLKAGASGYLLKDSAFSELIQAIHVIVGGHLYLTPSLTSVVVRDYVDHLPDREEAPGSVLTGREREVLQLVAEGKTTREIADLLHLSARTVETHRQNIMSKLDKPTLADLIKYALREGLTSLDD
jgi:two-component system, NarL family, response regulator NreC